MVLYLPRSFAVSCSVDDHPPPDFFSMNRKLTCVLVASFVALAATASAQFKSRDVGGLRLLKPGKTTEVAPGKDYDLEGYGLMFGLHVGSDEGRFTYAKMKGDFDVTVRIEDIHSETKAMTEAGLMVRKSLHPCDLMLGMAVTSNEYEGEADQYTFMRRTKFAGFLFDSMPKQYEGGMGNDAFSYNATGYQPKNQNRLRPFPHVWLRLQREGDVYTAYSKENDAEWRKIGSVTLDLGEEPLVGMFVTANHHSKSAYVGNPASGSFVKFRDLTGFPPPPPPKTEDAPAPAAK